MQHITQSNVEIDSTEHIGIGKRSDPRSDLLALMSLCNNDIYGTIGTSRNGKDKDICVCPPNPKIIIGPWNDSTIGHDDNIIPLC